MSSVISCHLKSLTNLHDPIALPHRECIFIGRSFQTQIENIKCSRKQVSLIADYESQEIIVKHEGQAPSCIDGVVLNKNQYYIARNDSLVELICGALKYKVHFILKEPVTINKKSLNRVDLNSNKRIKLEKPESITMGWNDVGNGSLLIYTTSGVIDREKIAAFDMDGTLIKTKTGHTFPINTEDWKIIYNVVKPKLEDLFKKGYKLVIFTNQAAIGRGRVNIPDFKAKIEAIVKELSVPIQVFISTTRDIFRKPAPGMWNYLYEHNSVLVKLEESMYIGDAAGRIANWEPGRKKDFSISDRMFASNIGLNFCTPEEFFLGRPKVPFDSPSFIPSVYEADDHNDYDIPSVEPEVILMVGAPGSGKSNFVKNYLIPEGYISISRDVLHSWQKCIAALESAIQRKSNCVIDNTNPDVESRKRYLDVCKQHKVKVRCFVLSTTIERCHHNNTFREINDVNHASVSPIIINKFRKNYIEPTLEEGFEKIVAVPFIPIFESPSEENLYKMYLFSKWIESNLAWREELLTH